MNTGRSAVPLTHPARHRGRREAPTPRARGARRGSRAGWRAARLHLGCRTRDTGGTVVDDGHRDDASCDDYERPGDVLAPTDHDRIEHPIDDGAADSAVQHQPRGACAVPPSPTTAANALPAALHGADWERISTSRKVAALTFDGGSSDTAVASILRTLASAKVRATFFVTGDFARRYPTQVARIRSAGHLVGNHSDRHRAYPGLTNEQIRADLAAADRAIVAAGGGTTTRPFFRFPFGDRAAADIRVVNDSGYLCVRWTVDTLGWKGTSGGVDAAVVRRRVLDTARPGQVVLMHVGSNPDDGTTLDADALPSVVAGLRSMGYGFVTLVAMVG